MKTVTHVIAAAILAASVAVAAPAVADNTEPCPVEGPCTPTPCPEGGCPPADPVVLDCAIPDHESTEALELEITLLRAALKIEHRNLMGERRKVDRKNATIDRLRALLRDERR